jgi:Ca2+-binding RTX toxin-like protein
LNFERANGSSFADTIIGNSSANTLNGLGGVDTLTGGAALDTFVFNRGQANGDTLTDFNGNDAAAGDQLRFVGYGPDATFTKVDDTHWQINFNGGASHETLTFSNAASVHTSDYLFL